MRGGFRFRKGKQNGKEMDGICEITPESNWKETRKRKGTRRWEWKRGAHEKRSNRLGGWEKF